MGNYLNAQGLEEEQKTWRRLYFGRALLELKFEVLNKMKKIKNDE